MQASVVIATYQRNEVLVNSIRSVHRSLRQGDELIVVDQSPRHDACTEAYLTDGAKSGAFTLITLERPGLGNARNVGAAASTRDILIYVDDDVLVPPSFIASHVAHYEDPRVACVAGHASAPDGMPFFAVNGTFVTRIVGANMSFRRTVFDLIGGFDARLQVCRDDYDIAARLLKTGYLIANGPDCALTHLAAVDGGSGLRQSSIGSFRKIYHDSFYVELKRPLTGRLLSMPRYVLSTIRWRSPGLGRLFSPSFFWGAVVSGHVDGLHSWREERRRHRRPPLGTP